MRHVKKKHTPVLVTKCRNSKSLNLIFTKKYTDHLTIIRNNYIKFHEIWISRSQVTVRHVYAGQTDGTTDRRYDGQTDGHRTFIYHNTSRQNFDGRIKIGRLLEKQNNGHQLDRHKIERRFRMLFYYNVRFGCQFEERKSIRDRTLILVLHI